MIFTRFTVLKILNSVNKKLHKTDVFVTQLVVVIKGNAPVIAIIKQLLCVLMPMSQAHKLHDNIHDIELSTLDARTVGEVKAFAIIVNAILVP